MAADSAVIVHGPVSLSDYLGDLVVYRNLQPVDSRVPGLRQLGPSLGLPDGLVPRKTEIEYSRVVAAMLGHAAELSGHHRPMRKLVALGDTRLYDVSAFRNLCRVTGWQGQAFVCAERPSEPEAMEQSEAAVYLSNRWQLLLRFAAGLDRAGLAVDDETVVMVDIDKTAVGARGRNDHTIDEARIEGVRRTANALLGATYDEPRFLAAYFKLNQQPYHSFTADNQDYLVYICLIIAAGLRPLDEVVSSVEAGQLTSFAQFIGEMNERAAEMRGTPLFDVHESVYALFRSGDPTPFKAFRHNEFRATIERFGRLSSPLTAEEALAGEIVVTHEVVELAREWRARGALVFGISDKPDEAALPTPQAASEGYLPLHRARTHCVGEPFP